MLGRTLDKRGNATVMESIHSCLITLTKKEIKPERDSYSLFTKESRTQAIHTSNFHIQGDAIMITLSIAKQMDLSLYLQAPIPK